MTQRTTARLGLRALPVLVLGLLAMPALGADANFQALCTYEDPDSFLCEFDADRAPAGQATTSCAPSQVSSYQWRFGDGMTDVTAIPETQHLYVQSVGVPSLFPFLEACLSVRCEDGSSAFTCHCVDLFGRVSAGGCVEPDVWSPL
ncbi:MAG: hypothetical protein AAF725_02775 [Acidobacteriota bacterium]